MRKCRILTEISQEKLAEILGKSNRTIGRYEDGESVPTLTDIEIMCDLFHVSPNYLVWGDTNGNIEDEILLNLISKCTSYQKQALISLLESFKTQ